MVENEGQPVEEANNGFEVSGKLLTYLFLGLCIIVVGLVLVVASSVFGGSGSVGGVVFVGPIPVVFGVGPEAAWLILFSLIIAVVMFVLFFVWRRRT